MRSLWVFEVVLEDHEIVLQIPLPRDIMDKFWGKILEDGSGPISSIMCRDLGRLTKTGHATHNGRRSTGKYTKVPTTDNPEIETMPTGKYPTELSTLTIASRTLPKSPKSLSSYGEIFSDRHPLSSARERSRLASQASHPAAGGSGGTSWGLDGIMLSLTGLSTGIFRQRSGSEITFTLSKLASSQINTLDKQSSSSIGTSPSHRSSREPYFMESVDHGLSPHSCEFLTKSSPELTISDVSSQRDSLTHGGSFLYPHKSASTTDGAIRLSSNDSTEKTALLRHTVNPMHVKKVFVTTHIQLYECLSSFFVRDPRQSPLTRGYSAKSTLFKGNDSSSPPPVTGSEGNSSLWLPTSKSSSNAAIPRAGRYRTIDWWPWYRHKPSSASKATKGDEKLDWRHKHTFKAGYKSEGGPRELGAPTNKRFWARAGSSKTGDLLGLLKPLFREQTEYLSSTTAKQVRSRFITTDLEDLSSQDIETPAPISKPRPKNSKSSVSDNNDDFNLSDLFTLFQPQTSREAPHSVTEPLVPPHITGALQSSYKLETPEYTMPTTPVFLPPYLFSYTFSVGIWDTDCRITSPPITTSGRGHFDDKPMILTGCWRPWTGALPTATPAPSGDLLRTETWSKVSSTSQSSGAASDKAWHPADKHVMRFMWFIVGSMCVTGLCQFQRMMREEGDVVGRFIGGVLIKGFERFGWDKWNMR